jgi:hypothetical protein
MPEIVIGEVVEVNLMLPPYSMPDDGPKSMDRRLVDQNRGWYRATVYRVMGHGGLIWVEFGKMLTKENLVGCEHISHYYGAYNAIYHVGTVRRLSLLDRIAAET